MWQLKTNKLKFCFWLIIVQLGGIGNSSAAQIVPDHSLPNNSAVTRDGTRFTIEEGTVRGSNLFHSFSKFNVNTGKIAFFNNGLSIDNIITRVTGGELSSIDGLIQANGTANLFLLNPSGIQFGANARIDIGGSFVGSTADSFLFEDGTIYSATNPTETPLLTVSVPLGLQYGSDPTPVRVEEANLEVKSGQTLTLAGGDLSIVGGELRASDGRISLGSATAGILTLDEDLGIADLSGTTRGNINLSQESLVEVTGNSEGIDLTTGNLTFTEGSQLQSLTTVPGETGDIKLDVTDRIIIDGLNSRIVSRSLGANGGVGGNIIINQTANPQGDLILSDGGLIGTSTESKSNGGDIQVNVNNIRSTASNLISNASGGGNSGAVKITSDSEVVFEDSLISTNIIAGNGNAGTITIDAENIFLTDSEISASNLAQGDAGNILINVSDRIFIDSDSLINNEISQLSLGNAGTLQITTRDLALDNSSLQSSNLEIASEVISLGNNSQLLATKTVQSQENVISITADSLEVTNGSQILANNSSEFDAGNINLKIRDNLTLSGENTGLFANTELDSSGKAGNILIDTESLLISEGAVVQGSGAGGNIEVIADDLTLDNQASISTETVSTEGGNIKVTLDDQLLLSRNSKISANSGDIYITSPEIALEEDSLIANVGTLKITTSDLAVFNSSVQSGNLEIASEVISLDNNSQLEVKTTAQNQENAISITADSLEVTNGSQILANNNSDFDTGNINLKIRDNLTLSGENAGLFANGEPGSSGKIGNIVIDTANLLISEGAIVGVKAQGSGAGGNLEVTADDLTLDNQALVSTETVSTEGGNISLNLNDQLLLNRNSKISAKPGNIDITSPEIILVEDSLIANVGTLKITTSDLGVLNSSLQSSNLEIASEVISLDNNSQLQAITTEQSQENGITITANNLDLTDGSQILANNGSEFDAGNINLKIRDNLTFSGGNTGLFANGEPSSSGKVGNIVIDTTNLLISEGAAISIKAQGSGAGGNIEVTANNLTLDNKGSLTTATISNKGGNITLNLNDQLLLRDNSKISAKPGNIDISSPEIILVEDSLIANVGTLKITTGDLALRNSSVQSSNLEIASEVISLDNNSQLEVKTTAQSQENGIAITANNLDLTDGSQILANNGSEFDAGNINLKIRDNLTFSGGNTGLFANGEPGSSGKVGNIVIDTANLLISEGAIVGVKAQGSGAGGNIEVTADDLTLDNQASISTETVSNQGGNITLNLNDQLLLRRNSNISTSSGTVDAGGDGGNININAAFIIAVPSENSDITANAFAGNGGQIDITTNGIFGLQFREEETPLSDILPSNFSFSQLTLLNTVPLNNPDIDREGVKLPDRVTLSSDRVNVGCAAAEGNWLTISGRGGLPTDPTTTIRGQSLLSDLRDFTNSENKKDLSPVRKQSREELPTSIVQVNGWIINQDGDIELVAALPQETSLTKGYDCPPNSND